MAAGTLASTNWFLTGMLDPHTACRTPQTIECLACDYGFRAGAGRLYQDHYGEVPGSILEMVRRLASGGRRMGGWRCARGARHVFGIGWKRRAAPRPATPQQRSTLAEAATLRPAPRRCRPPKPPSGGRQLQTRAVGVPRLLPLQRVRPHAGVGRKPRDQGVCRQLQGRPGPQTQCACAFCGRCPF